MKRIITSLIFSSLLTLTALAVPPKLAVESLFDRKDLRKEGYSISRITGEGNYFRQITAENDRKLLEETKKMIDIDKKRASNVVERFADGKDYIILNIPNNNQIINVGLYWNDSGYMRLFIQSDPSAFE